MPSTRRSSIIPRVIAVTSGKGGVGKTNVSVNLAIAFAQIGRRVVLWDLDLGLANVDVILNLRVKADLSDGIGTLTRDADYVIWVSRPTRPSI